MAVKNFLDLEGVTYLWAKVKSAITGAVPTGATSAPIMDSNAYVGASDTWARADHVHPSDSTKVDKVSGYSLTKNDFTDTLKSKLDGIASGAEVNQNTFSNVKVGSVTLQADGKSDTVELVAGSNISLSANASNDSVTIASSYSLPTATYTQLGAVVVGNNISVANGKISVPASTYETAGVVTLVDSYASDSTTAAATANALKTAYDTLESVKADTAATLSGYGITDAYTKAEIDTVLSATFTYKGSYDTYTALTDAVTAKTITPKTGDVYNIRTAGGKDTYDIAIKEGDNVAYNGSGWDVLGGTTNLSAYVLATDTLSNDDIDAAIK